MNESELKAATNELREILEAALKLLDSEKNKAELRPRHGRIY